MSNEVFDLIDAQDVVLGYCRKFILWPKAWKGYSKRGSNVFNWAIYPFKPSAIHNIPNKNGIYTFIIKPGIANHSCTYLMYLGKAEDQTLRERYKNYLQEKQSKNGRTKIIRLLNKYTDEHLYFCCASIRVKKTIEKQEKLLIDAFIPPCNCTYSAKINKIVKGIL